MKENCGLKIDNSQGPSLFTQKQSDQSYIEEAHSEMVCEGAEAVANVPFPYE